MPTMIEKLFGVCLIPKRLFNKFRMFREEIINLRETSRILSIMIANDFGERQYCFQNTAGNTYHSTIREVNSGVWTNLTGPDFGSAWSLFDVDRIRAIVEYDNKIYCGVSSVNRQDASVYVLDGKLWKVVGGKGSNGSWKHQRECISLAVYKDVLFAGTLDGHQAALWFFTKSDNCWKEVDLSNIVPRFKAVNSMVTDENYLYVTISDGELADQINFTPKVLRFNGECWEDITPLETWKKFPYSEIYELHIHTDGILFATFISSNPDSNNYSLLPTWEIWSFDQAEWNYEVGSCSNLKLPVLGYALRFASIGDELFVVGDRYPNCGADFTTIWKKTRSSWLPVGLGQIPLRWGHYKNVNAVCNFNGSLIVGFGGRPGGYSAIEAYTPENGWKVVGGFTTTDSWAGKKGNECLVDVHAREYVYRMLCINNDLLVCFGSSPGTGQIWKYSENC
ncbi:hypothetical protein OAP53_00150 [Alphaproteobacteria bacterium]|nr:hypothetical protein [Alphaproteobacteria bacterium]